ncbi:hypothetical protein GCM10007424_18340 [Flavobacterium suaedae]|uniref:DUF541 domain-containing protein n=1 Tax=Flavobacterium suaedae TaxID=1767027 RepID=A0ABQ1JVK7_9FLAO|nr:SIMPL domain-containing protein [Flavobacterium suaedae]GGB78528.1 hypothetical protein GCM10007424_18340 [Flavobacterium suaedae]
MMNKILLIFTFLVSFGSFSQEKFIEVEVRDTITLKPIKFEYIISINSPQGVFDEEGNYNQDFIENYKEEKKAELKKLLKLKKYDFKVTDDSSFEINSGYVHLVPDDDFTVTVYSLEGLEKLRDELKVLDYISARVGNIQYEGEGDKEFERKLLKKLIDEAKDKAGYIASLSGLKLGNIVEVKEVKEIDGFSFNMMSLLSAIPTKSMTSFQDDNFQGSLFKAMVVKFAVE